MAHQGYLSYGGSEIVNNARAKGYVTSAGCSVQWVVGNVCEGLADALGDEPYTLAQIEDAPWYDSDIPDLSSRFFGVYALKIEGLDDSTESATMIEGITSGGRLGRSRAASRSVRVRVALSAQGEDALDYGKTWLRAVVAGHNCSQHGASCGVGDAEFFAAGPPARGEVVEYGEWVDEDVNVVPSPGFETLESIPEGGERSNVWSISPGGHSLYVAGDDGYGEGVYGEGPYGLGVSD